MEDHGQKKSICWTDEEDDCEDEEQLDNEQKQHGHDDAGMPSSSWRSSCSCTQKEHAVL